MLQTAYINKFLDADNFPTPITRDEVDRWVELSAADFARDKSWFRAIMPVQTRKQINRLFLGRLVLLAKAYGFIVFRWRKPPASLSSRNTQSWNSVSSFHLQQRDDLYDYFVQDMPARILHNLNLAAGVNNGVRGICHTLIPQDEDDIVALSRDNAPLCQSPPHEGQPAWCRPTQNRLHPDRYPQYYRLIRFPPAMRYYSKRRLLDRPMFSKTLTRR